MIVLGSDTRGIADEGSDLDLMLVETELTDKPGEYLRLRQALGRVAPAVGVDLLLYPLAEFECRSQVAGTILFEARMAGKLLRDATH